MGFPTGSSRHFEHDFQTEAFSDLVPNEFKRIGARALLTLSSNWESLEMWIERVKVRRDSCWIRSAMND